MRVVRACEPLAWDTLQGSVYTGGRRLSLGGYAVSLACVFAVHKRVYALRGL